ncbi:type I restriction enzyme R protein N-terminal domain protein [Leptospira kirschneri str. 200803703]|uniref:Type I restriction enzyme R protein N-terminal domain protein n=1 Tax=Leptospira kirschneri str. 200802841 TaxID=1193047 RepID=A0A828XYS4_9LEPT|nr:type I restriction enzyme HsdR N-terminal domain-containing protein [Leptospira kirschneri]EKO49813.1 type I restriction enzyme R protein N-terminal domain protein [Leptospira kirschneri str. 200802841]EMJ87453.1 type I restriction enzyme R protein N-terminal domain protein [Leptospira kirschneri str. JB]EMO66821.1 type I restriction enzyme R protein N-terminal domain protein [Leptospira kirschneri str. 200803703]EMO75303.1 type I restriction enzyme R protein N-terminal domain protein [Lepto
MAIPTKIFERISSGVKKFQPILTSAKARDVNESDTVVIITDLLSEVFGYDKYSEITTEHVIKKTFCDLAIKIDGKVKLLIEIKAIGLELKDDYIRQAIDYGANSGIEWVILTNGMNWQIYRITFSKPIDKEMVYEINFSNINPKIENHIEPIYYLCKEALGKSLLDEYHSQKQALSKYYIGQMILTETVLDVIKRELKRLTPGVKIENDEIEEVLRSDVIKRDALEGDKAVDAKKKIQKAANTYLRNSSPAPKKENMPSAVNETETQKNLLNEEIPLN